MVDAVRAVGANMKVALINSSFSLQPRDHLQRHQPHPRLGVASIAAYLRQHGTEVFVIDPQVLKLDPVGTAVRVVRNRPDYVGFAAHTEEIHDAADIAREIKRRDPSIRCVIGGYHVSALPMDTLSEFDCFDFGIVGEGEHPLRELVEGNPLHEILGMAYRDDTGQIVVNGTAEGCASLDDLPPPAWDLYDLKRYPRGLPIEFIRSCPYSCSFCFKATGRRVRYKSVEPSLDEIESGVREHGVRDFFFVCSGTFPLKRRHGMEICEGIIRRGLNIRWFTATRVDRLDEELLTVMKQSGCVGINFGLESGDACILDACQKGTTLERAEKIVRLCHKVGIPTELNFILGLPNETPESLRNTLRFVSRLRDGSALANFAILVPLPGTEVYAMALRNEGGIRIRTRDWRLYTKAAGQAITHDRFTPEQLKRFQAQMYLSYYCGSFRKIIQLFRSGAVFKFLRFRRMLSLLRQLYAPAWPGDKQ